MAEYYALLARAVGRLQPSTETARREIYTKARNALIQQLKAITPPLSVAEISKQRLELEEAIRKVERETANANTEADISRSAARAMEEALAPPPPASEPRTAVPPPVMRPAAAEPVRAESVTPRAAAAPTPAEVRSRAVAAETDDEDNAFSVGTPTPMPPPRPTVTRSPRPIPAAPGAALRQSQAANAPMSDADMADIADGGGRRGRRAARKDAPRGRTAKPVKRRSVLSRLILFVLILAVLGAGGYAAFKYRDEIQDFFSSVTGGDETTEGDAADATPGADAAAVGGDDAVRVVGPQPEDAPVAPNNNVVGIQEPAFLETQAILYEAVAADGVLPAYEGTITWAFEDTPDGARVIGTINVPERNLVLVLSMEQAPDTNTTVSHTMDVIVTAPADFPGGGIQSLGQLAAKSSEDAIGTPIVATAQALPPDYFLLEFDRASVRTNMSQLRQDWFDLGLVYANGQRAIITFNKGTEGREVFAQALQAWGN